MFLLFRLRWSTVQSLFGWNVELNWYANGAVDKKYGSMLSQEYNSQVYMCVWWEWVS